jgi:hypothetical protein
MPTHKENEEVVAHILSERKCLTPDPGREIISLLEVVMVECQVCGELGSADHGCADPICPACKADGWVMGFNGPLFIEEDAEPYDDYAVEAL